MHRKFYITLLKEEMLNDSKTKIKRKNSLISKIFKLFFYLILLLKDFVCPRIY